MQGFTAGYWKPNANAQASMLSKVFKAEDVHDCPGCLLLRFRVPGKRSEKVAGKKKHGRMGKAIVSKTVSNTESLLETGVRLVRQPVRLTEFFRARLDPCEGDAYISHILARVHTHISIHIHTHIHIYTHI